jgi:hypothetical protein
MSFGIRSNSCFSKDYAVTDFRRITWWNVTDSIRSYRIDESAAVHQNSAVYNNTPRVPRERSQRLDKKIGTHPTTYTSDIRRWIKRRDPLKDSLCRCKRQNAIFKNHTFSCQSGECTDHWSYSSVAWVCTMIWAWHANSKLSLCILSKLSFTRPCFWQWEETGHLPEP